MAKCNVSCKYYSVYKSSDNTIKVECVIRGLLIKDIKEKLPGIYNDCPKHCAKKK